MMIVFPIEPNELRMVCSALARYYNTELKKLRAIQKRENAGKGTRVRVSEKVMFMGEIKMLLNRARKLLDEMAPIVNKENKHA